jgi:hypothetical protein
MVRKHEEKHYLRGVEHNIVSVPRIMMFFVVGLFFLLFFTVDIYAVENAKGTLGICYIKDPVYDENNRDNTPYATEYDRVYFGWIPESPKARLYNKGATALINPYEGISDAPLYWRVLNTKSNASNEENALFMLMEYALPTKVPWDNRESGNGQRWSNGSSGSSETTDSQVRVFLQGTSFKGTYAGGSNSLVNVNSAGEITSDKKGFYDECFEREEQEAILETVNGERDNWNNSSGIGRCEKDPIFGADGSDRIRICKNPGNTTLSNLTFDDSYLDGTNNYYVLCGCGLRGDKLFLLSAKEALNKDYGFSNAYDWDRTGDSKGYCVSRDTNRIAKQLLPSGGGNSHWWLRSACSSFSNNVAYVYSSGECHDYHSNYTY